MNRLILPTLWPQRLHKVSHTVHVVMIAGPLPPYTVPYTWYMYVAESDEAMV